MDIRPITETEQKYTYTQSRQLVMQTGCIGHLRGDFDRSGTGFFTSWSDHGTGYKTESFKTELDDVINTLRFEKDGLLQNRLSMCRYAGKYPESAFEGNFCREYGFRVDTEKYSYLIRCNPTPGDYNFYVYCYVKDWLDMHMGHAKQGIRFIDSHYKELFRIADGDKIVITDALGDKKERTCRFIDEYHTEIGSELYHICQFAELMNRNGSAYEPKEKEAVKMPENGRGR